MGTPTTRLNVTPMGRCEWTLTKDRVYKSTKVAQSADENMARKLREDVERARKAWEDGDPNRKGKKQSAASSLFLEAEDPVAYQQVKPAAANMAKMMLDPTKERAKEMLKQIGADGKPLPGAESDEMRSKR